MNAKRTLVFSLLSIVVILSTTLSAQDKKLKKSDLPPAVQKAAEEVSKGATVKGYGSEMEGGKLNYEVELMVNGHSKDVSIAPDGTVLEIEEEVAIDALPAAVREGLQKEAGKGTIKKVESLTKNGKLVAYEAAVVTGTKKSEVQVGPDGKKLGHKE
jgi:uncharacterized membrane protein YkoI